jgi:hypothetical protein
MNHSLVTSCRDKERWIKKNITEFQVAWMYWRPWSKDWTIVVLCRSQSETLQSLLKHYIIHDYINWYRRCPLLCFWQEKNHGVYHCCLVASRGRVPWPLEFHWRSIQTMDVPALEMRRNQQIKCKSSVRGAWIHSCLLCHACLQSDDPWTRILVVYSTCDEDEQGESSGTDGVVHQTLDG